MYNCISNQATQPIFTITITQHFQHFNHHQPPFCHPKVSRHSVIIYGKFSFNFIIASIFADGKAAAVATAAAASVYTRTSYTKVPTDNSESEKRGKTECVCKSVSVYSHAALSSIIGAHSLDTFFPPFFGANTAVRK